jgi:hypothetical protein
MCRTIRHGRGRITVDGQETGRWNNRARSSDWEPEMRYIVAGLGGLLVMIGAFVGIMMLTTVIFPEIFEEASGLILMYILVIPVAILAGVSSFRATLRHYTQKDGMTRTPKSVITPLRIDDNEVAAQWRSAERPGSVVALPPSPESVRGAENDVRPRTDGERPLPPSNRE